MPVATRLLEHRDALVRGVDFWLEEIEAVLPYCQTPLPMVSLKRDLEAAPELQQGRAENRGTDASDLA